MPIDLFLTHTEQDSLLASAKARRRASGVVAARA
jgi:hypothetical protein